MLKSLSGETLCKFAQIFPPKDLIYFWKFFLDTFVMKVIVNKSRAQCWLLCVVRSRKKIKDKLKNTLYSLGCFIIFNSSSWVDKLLFLKKKKYDACAVGAPYFFQVFWSHIPIIFSWRQEINIKIFLRTLWFKNKTATWLHDLGDSFFGKIQKRDLDFFLLSVGLNEATRQRRNGKFQSVFLWQVDTMVAKMKTLTKQSITAA